MLICKTLEMRVCFLFHIADGSHWWFEGEVCANINPVCMLRVLTVYNLVDALH